MPANSMELTEMSQQREAKIRALRNELRELELQNFHERMDKLLAMPKDQWLKRG